MSSKAFNRIALIIFAVVLLSVIDSCSAAFGPPRVFRLTPGETILVSGDLDDAPMIPNRWLEEPDMETIRGHLGYTANTPGLKLNFIELRGRLWRGELDLSNADPGDYTLQVFNAASKTKDMEPVYTVRLFPDRESLRADLPSFSERHLNIRPIMIFFMALPLALAMLFFSHLRSGREEAALQARGIGSVYKLARSKAGWEIMVGLGSAHGVHPGDRLRILDKNMRDVGELQVSRVGREGSNGVLPLDANIRSGYFVALADSVPHGPNRS